MDKSRSKLFRWITWCLILMVTTACNTAKNNGVQFFNLKKIADHAADGNFVSLEKESEDQVLKITPGKDQTGLIIWEKGDQQRWTDGNYLVFEIYGNNDYSGVINIEFYKEAEDSVSHKKESNLI